MDPRLMALMGADQIGARATGEVQGPPDPVSFEDPEQRLEVLREAFDLTDEEVMELAVPAGPEGPSLADRLRRLRPNANLGDLELGFDGNQVTGRIEF